MPAAYYIAMEITFSKLKQKEVISLTDGKHLGRVCDITFGYPDNCVLGFTVTGCKSMFKFGRQEQFLPVKSVVKIGEDAVLVNTQPPKGNPPPPPKPPCPPPQDRRSLDEYE